MLILEQIHTVWCVCLMMLKEEFKDVGFNQLLVNVVIPWSDRLKEVSIDAYFLGLFLKFDDRKMYEICLFLQARDFASIPRNQPQQTNMKHMI